MLLFIGLERSDPSQNLFSLSLWPLPGPESAPIDSKGPRRNPKGTPKTPTSHPRAAKGRHLLCVALHFCISALLHFCISAFSAFLHFCVSAFLHFCTSAFPHFRISAFSVRLHFCISARLSRINIYIYIYIDIV